MKTKMNVIASMCNNNMRKHNGNYTFGFSEGKYTISYHDHSTGRHLRIHLIAQDGDRLEVYDQTEWYSSRYHFNGFGKGYTPGPWVKEIESMFAGFRKELAQKLWNDRKLARANRAIKEQEEKQRLSKFAALCAA